MNNPYLDKFLEAHSRPKVVLDPAQHNMFNLKMFETHDFKPPIRKAPFLSTGEPWPMPAKYISSKETLYRLNPVTFKMVILNKTCDILEDAINRYTKLIVESTIEEHYEYIYNYDDDTYNERMTQVNAKYSNVRPMANLVIDVRQEECKYPHVNMNESCKYNFI